MQNNCDVSWSEDPHWLAPGLWLWGRLQPAGLTYPNLDNEDNNNEDNNNEDNNNKDNNNKDNDNKDNDNEDNDNKYNTN